MACWWYITLIWISVLHLPVFTILQVNLGFKAGSSLPQHKSRHGSSRLLAGPVNKALTTVHISGRLVNLTYYRFGRITSVGKLWYFFQRLKTKVYVNRANLITVCAWWQIPGARSACWPVLVLFFWVLVRHFRPPHPVFLFPGSTFYSFFFFNLFQTVFVFQFSVLAVLLRLRGCRVHDYIHGWHPQGPRSLKTRSKHLFRSFVLARFHTISFTFGIDDAGLSSSIAAWPGFGTTPPEHKPERLRFSSLNPVRTTYWTSCSCWNDGI
jgi:hypothetical protein